MIKLVLNSASNFTEEFLKQTEVDYLKYEIVYKGKNIPSSLTWDVVSKDELIDYMSQGNLVTINQPPLGEWRDKIESLMKDGSELACILTSHNLGGAVRAFNIVKNIVDPDNRIRGFEVNGAGPCEELIGIELARVMTKYITFEDIERYFNKMNKNLHYYAISESMRQWAYTGRSNDKKVEFTYPEGLPLMKGQPDGHILPLCLCKTFDEALEKFREEISNYEAEKCAINYTYRTYPDWIERFEKVVIDTLKCEVIAKNYHGPTVTCVEGVNSVDVAFI